MKEIKENEVTVIRVNIDTREKLNKIRKDISKITRLNISTDNLINLMINGFDQEKIRLVIHVY